MEQMYNLRNGGKPFSAVVLSRADEVAGREKREGQLKDGLIALVVFPTCLLPLFPGFPIAQLH